MVGILVAELVRVEEGVAEEAGAAGSQHVLVHRLLQVIQQLAQLTLPSHASNLNRGTLTVRHRNIRYRVWRTGQEILQGKNKRNG
jgi:hypothetical protein